MAMTAVQACEARGRRAGRCEIQLHQMRAKFGKLPDGVVAQMEAIRTLPN